MIDVIIIGAGAAGLSAARLLAKSGKSVCILEARDRIGGRIHSLQQGGFSVPVEAGAEFMHGELPLTTALMNDAKVAYLAGHGQNWSVKNNQLSKSDHFENDWQEVMDRLQQLKTDMTIGDFLQKFFNEPKYKPLVDGVKSFVQGYDAADVDKASAMALREEWENENIEGYRPVGGYGQLIDFLWNETRKLNGILNLMSVVRRVNWKSSHVEVVTEKGETLSALKVLITVPISVLKNNAIQFDPPLPQYQTALQQLEMGEVIKFLFEFKDRIWDRKDITGFRKMPNMNFLFSDAFVPTWWTQAPNDVPLLTGWLAGPLIRTIRQDDSFLQTQALQSIAYLLGCEMDALTKEIRFSKIVNWSADEYSRGAYAYKTIGGPAAIKTLTTPAENTIYFAGEALYDGPEMGTVEAALASGQRAAEKILQ